MNRRYLCVVGCAGYMAIAVLSLLPGGVIVRTGAPGGLAHLLACGLASGLVGFSVKSKTALFSVAVSVATAAAILEIAQHFVPGRHANIEGFFLSTAGAWVGLVVSFNLRPSL